MQIICNFLIYIGNKQNSVTFYNFCSPDFKFGKRSALALDLCSVLRCKNRLGFFGEKKIDVGASLSLS